MGKKKDKKKGNSAEKTALKTEKKLANKQKKELRAIGEDDIEKIIQSIEQEEAKRSKVTEHAVGPPSRRLNFTFVPHPDKDELILYGGEFFNGQKTFVYNDLFFYNIITNSWSLLKSPGGPPPRCGHQMVVTSSNKGQLWIFGGEYASPTQSQFYHYRDLWVFHFKDRQWEKIQAPNGPSGRSGHRMVLSKKKIFVFGGFHDNLRDYKYFNDLHCFDLDTYKWVSLEVKGAPPPPRSGCCMVALGDGRILITGGYSKERVKKDVDKGKIFADAHLLTPDKNDTTGLKYKWMSTKLGGIHFPPRCGMTLATNRNMAYTFGGVFDVDENEEEICSTFYDDLFNLDLEKLMWRDVKITGKKESNKPRRKKADNEKGDENEDSDDDFSSSSERPSSSSQPEVQTIADDGIFKVTVGPSLTQKVSTVSIEDKPANVFWPSSRMNAGVAVKNNILYIFGGMVEDGEKDLTLGDFYALDLKKLEEWKVLIEDDLNKMEWINDESDDNNEDDGESSDDDSEEDDSDDE